MSARHTPRRFALLAAVALAVTSFAAIGSAPATAASPAGPLIRQILRAVGGPDSLAQVDDMIVTAAGTAWTLDEGYEPGSGATQPAPYSTTTTVDPGEDRVRVDLDIVSFGFVQRQLTEIVDPGAGYLIGQNANFSPPVEMAMTSDRWASTRLHQMLLHPQLLMAAIADGRYDARAVGPVALSGVPHDVLVVLRDDAPLVRIFADANSHLISRIDTVESDPLRRDVELRVEYDRWRAVGDGVQSPLRVKVFYDRVLIQEETRTSVAVNTGVADDTFEPPAGAVFVEDPQLAERGVSSHQHLQSFSTLGFPLDGLQLDVVATELAPGVHWLTGGSHHSLLVEHDDGLVLVDAPRTQYRAEAILAFVADEFPGRPITHMVQSHHHADHSAGARTVLATGAELVVHEAAADLWRRVISAPSTVVPDALELAPVTVDLTRVPPGGAVTVGTGDNAVRVLSFEQDHAADYVLVVTGGVVFTVDVYSPDPSAPLPPIAQDIIGAVVADGLPVNVIAGGHGGFVDLTSAFPPVVFVHGQSGSAQQFETQAMRFTSNGYPQEHMFAFEYDTSVSDNPLADLDAYLDDVLAQTGADEVYAIGHSRGTSVWTSYLDDPTFGGADKVAKYVNVDGRSPAELPGGVPTIGIWGEWNTAGSGFNRRGDTDAQIGPDQANNFHFADKSHTEVMTSPEAFAHMYEFLTGNAPTTTDVVAEPPATVSVSGRAVIFPENIGVDGGALDLWRIDPATGQRIDAGPLFSQGIDATGEFGPVTVDGSESYELAVTRTDGSVHHFYFEPFARSDHFVRLNTSRPGEGLEAFVPRSDASSGFVVSRQREFWGDQGADSDELLVDGLNLLNSTTSPRSAVNLAVFGFDAGLDGATDLTSVPFPFDFVTFITAADVFIPSDGTATTSYAVTDAARGGAPTTINVPTWPSSDHRVTVQFRDDIQ